MCHEVSDADTTSYHNALGQITYMRVRDYRHYMTKHLKVSDSDILSTLEHYDTIRQMLVASGWGAPMTDELSDSCLSLVVLA